MIPRRSEEGAALLTVLLLVAVMAVMATTALERLQLATQLSINSAAIEQARAYGFAAETVARYRIGDLIQREAARTTLEGDWAGRATNFPIDGGVATARLDDGGNCFNLNSLVDALPGGRLVARPIAAEQFARLLVLSEVPLRDAQAIAAAAADWIDSDVVPLPGGAEDSAYTVLTPPRRTAGTLMIDRSELRSVAGVTPTLYARLAPFVCALPVTDASAINVNTLRPQQAMLLAMLMPGVDVARAGAAIGQRPPTGWESLTAFFALPQLAGTALDPGRGQVRLATRWFTLALVIDLAGAELEENALLDAERKPAIVVRRSYGEAS